MAVVSLDDLLEPLSEAAPCGPNLEYTDAFFALESLVAGVPARQDLQTGAEMPAEPPSWPVVVEKARELMSRSKDLRVALYYVQAAAYALGPTAVASGMQLVASWLNQYWDSVHPQQDPEDTLDSSIRVYVLAGLCDPEGVLKAIREMVLVGIARRGDYTLRDIDIARGKIALANGPAPSLAEIDRLALDCELTDLWATASALRSAINSLDHIESALQQHLGRSWDLDLNPLRNVLADARNTVEDWISRRRGAEDLSSVTELCFTEVPHYQGEIKSRADVVHALDRICEFLARTEPANPVPLLLERAKRLMSKSFVEIIQDLAPEMMPRINQLRGLHGEET